MEPISKKQLKNDKIQRKRNSQRTFMKQQKKYNKDYSDIQNQTNEVKSPNVDYQVKFIDLQTQFKNANLWWNQLNLTYFKTIQRKDIILARNLTSAQKLDKYFNSQSQIFGSYFDQQILPYYPNLQQNSVLKVLFKSQSSFPISFMTYSCINFTQQINRRAIKKQQFVLQKIQDIQNIKIIAQKSHPTKILIEEEQSKITQYIKNLNFEYHSIINQTEILFKLIKFQQINSSISQVQDQIDIQIKLWQTQSENMNLKNSILWNTLLTNYLVKDAQIINEKNSIAKQTLAIKQLLINFTILRYFQHGTQDKTFKILQALIQSIKHIKPLKTRDLCNKKFFQTDCKICFCSFNSDSNQVLYCDMCNTSFHLACYGLHTIPEDKQYFCDCCAEMRKEQKIKNSSIKKLTCQICCKPNFPLKKINGHFYHMTCLVMFNFITVDQGIMRIKGNLSHEGILKKVFESEMNCNSCIFCSPSQGADSGMQFKCSFNNCNESMHPICAYINGCKFEVKKNLKEKSLDVKVFCNKHDVQRDYIQQSYLRRYLCNFKNTSTKTIQSFRAEYEEQLSYKKSRQSSKKSKQNQIPSLLNDQKNVKKYILQRQQKSITKTTEQQLTQTGKLLKSLAKNQYW